MIVIDIIKCVVADRYYRHKRSGTARLSVDDFAVKEPKHSGMKTTIADCTIYRDDITFVLADEFDGIVKDSTGAFVAGRTNKVYTSRKYAFAIACESDDLFAMTTSIVNSADEDKIDAVRSAIAPIFKGADISIEFVAHKEGDPTLDAEGTPMLDSAGNARTYAHDFVEPKLKSFGFGKKQMKSMKFLCSLCF